MKNKKSKKTYSIIKSILELTFLKIPYYFIKGMIKFIFVGLITTFVTVPLTIFVFGGSKKAQVINEKMDKFIGNML